MLKNKKAMLGNLIGGFVCILVMCSLLPVVAQQVLYAMGCEQGSNSTIDSASQVKMVYEDSATGSFGGAGAAHFGGYDGTVKKSWTRQVLKNTASVYGLEQPKCNNLIQSNVTSLSTSAISSIIGFVPLFFAICISLMAIGIIYSSFRQVGTV